MTLAPENLEATSTQPSNSLHVPNALDPPPMARATTQLVDDTTDVRLPANEYMVASVEAGAEKEGFFQPIHRQPVESAEKDMVDSDPLRSPRRTHFSTDPKEAHDVTVVEEEVDIVNSNGHTLYPDTYTKPSPTVPKGASHLRLNLKPPSPQPWELIDPPSEENGKGVRGFYSVGAQKFHTVQSARFTRPLIPKSSYYFGPPPSDSAFGTAPTGQIGVHHPREIIRVERDYTGGELVQFAPIYPLELEGRINPTQFLESINAINELLISAHSLRHSFLDNMLAVLSLQVSKHILTSHYEKEMQRLRYLFDDLNAGLYNPVGLNIVWPRDVAFLYLEIEYY